jgi:uncharacterized protein with FMN-binding domain
MRRAIVAIIGTAVGTAALVGIKAGLPNAQADNTAAAPLDSSGAPAAGGAGGGTAGQGGQPNGQPNGQPTAKPTAPGAASRSGRSAPPAPAGGTGLHQGTFTGTVAQTPYGPVQVRVTVAAGRMTDVAAVQLPRTEARSLDIDKTAVPAMRQEALKVQSANIHAVSGATYTSQGYKASLQAALDAAKRG